MPDHEILFGKFGKDLCQKTISDEKADFLDINEDGSDE